MKTSLYYGSLGMFKERRIEGKDFERYNSSLTIYSVPSWETAVEVHIDEHIEYDPGTMERMCRVGLGHLWAGKRRQRCAERGRGHHTDHGGQGRARRE